MSGVAGGWITFLLLNVAAIGGVGFVLSFAVRPFVRGPAVVLLSVSLAFGIILALAASGIAKSHFNLWFVLPFVLCAAIVAGIWLIAIKGQVLRG